jgi:hypothetical protein
MVKGMTVSILGVGQVNLELVPNAYGETSQIALVAGSKQNKGG